MIRTINEILGDFADKIGYDYHADIIPARLLDGTLQYPALLWVLPNGTSMDDTRWRFRSSLFIVRQRETGESSADNIAEMQSIANDLRAWLIAEARDNGREAFVDFDYKAMTAEPRTGFDNSGADAMEVSLTFFASKCE